MLKKKKNRLLTLNLKLPPAGCRYLITNCPYLEGILQIALTLNAKRLNSWLKYLQLLCTSSEVESALQ